VKWLTLGSKFVGFSDVAFGSKLGSRRTSYVRFRSKADMCGANNDVRFGPIADIMAHGG
jgi:hypothetical protein